MSEKPQGSRDALQDAGDRFQASDEGSREKDSLAPEDGSTHKKDRGLLHVPSRSSSQRIQPSPTSTGLSGATASDPRESMDGHSRESKGSMFGRTRNGSTSSNRSGVGTGPTATPGNSQPASPAVATHKKKKTGGILSIFGCCGVPDGANDLDAGEEPLPSHKVEKIPLRPTTASRRPGTPPEQSTAHSKPQVYERENPPHLPNEIIKNGKRISGTSSQDQSTVGDRDGESKQTTLVGANPVISVEPPLASGSGAAVVAESVAQEQDDEGDIPMPDAEISRQGQQHPADDPYTLPPPPPGPVPAVSHTTEEPIPEPSAAFVPEQPAQKALLPPKAPEFKGKKCLILDLDETLVHSSFKVRS